MTIDFAFNICTCGNRGFSFEKGPWGCGRHTGYYVDLRLKWFQFSVETHRTNHEAQSGE